MAEKRPGICLAITGASGAPYATRLLECLLQAGERVALLLSEAGQVVLGMETDIQPAARPAEMARRLQARFGVDAARLQVYGVREWTAPVASGTGAPRAMVVCPCTMGTLSAIASGASRNLIERAADVMIKEGRTLVLVPRETPFSAIHLENMLKLARLGVVVLPANPGFYHGPQSIGDLVDFIVARILDQLGLDQSLVPPWGA